MKKIIYSLGVCLLAGHVNAQFVNSTDFYVSEGAVVSFNTDVVNEGKITNNGKVHFQKNLENLSTVQSTGVAVFDGNGTQLIKSKNELSFSQLMLDNDVKLETPVRVNESVAFRRGVIESSSTNPLVFSADAKHSGASDFSHVRGVVKKEGSEAFEFPLGDGTNFRAFSVARNSESQTLSASYLYKSPLNISGQVSENVETINENEYWTLKSESVKASAKVAVNGQAGLEEVAYLKRGTWNVLEDSKLSASTDLSNGTLFTLAKSRNIKAEIGVYPNPTEGEYFLKLGGMNENEQITVDVTNQDGSTIMHKEGMVKDLRKAYQLPSNLPATELTVRVLRVENKPLVQKMILKK
ncbi:hypothetical protein GCM10011514_17620 [Emticicia aquatilis]|uniref:T9SS C-terminal target domain-containing protein n=1 Tax=Emticicia aquatilis TaxID=1537369 RepID=A0A917DN93_9BACT|nr:hypothetical protein [Emticicia aquatilis]GGD53925.1 hypothetical protein GCM10011514_17620 [Emticicia aquatilis]